MKKHLLSIAFVAVAILGLNTGANAQEVAKVTVTVDLKDVVGAVTDLPVGSKNIDFTYTTVGDYKTDQTRLVLQQVNVFSTGPYKITAAAKSPTFTGDKSSALPLDILSIKLKQNGGNDPYQASVPLTADGKTAYALKETGSGSIYYDALYTISGNNTKLLSATKGKYTVDVTYTVTTN